MKTVWNGKNLIKTLQKDGIVVIPTDTLYGIVGRALNENTVERIYKLRKRNPKKPCIVLIGNISELEKFSVTLSEKQRQVLKRYWPGPVSVVLECLNDKFSYLYRDTKTLAFRLPAQEALRDLLMKTGPLVAPSANPEGLLPARTIVEAKKYFGGAVDLYLDAGLITSKESKIIQLQKDGSVAVLRE